MVTNLALDGEFPDGDVFAVRRVASIDPRGISLADLLVDAELIDEFPILLAPGATFDFEFPVETTGKGTTLAMMYDLYP